jgi:hypothetical protein
MYATCGAGQREATCRIVTWWPMGVVYVKGIQVGLT